MDGCYVNYPDLDLPNRQTLYYKDNYPRLLRIKTQLDPHNSLYHAQSIELLS
ncbi:BBE domain-containing protein [Pseudoalteromonas aurantia]